MEITHYASTQKRLRMSWDDAKSFSPKYAFYAAGKLILVTPTYTPLDGAIALNLVRNLYQ